MAQAHAGAILHHIQRLFGTATNEARTDAVLLQQFAVQREEGAFTTLVQRHGRMVWGVCRHVLQHEQDAEDAFQATFLVFARRAGSIRKSEAVGSWLHGVAHRVAQKARTMAAKRRACERRAEPRPAATEPEPGWRELQAILDEELQHLPQKYRAPFVLCCLEGRSRSEAATELGWKAGTLSSRVAQARHLLQQRLARRGVTLSAALTAGVLWNQPASAALVQATRQAALLVAAGQSTAEIASPSVAALVQDGLRMVASRKMALVAVVLLTASIVSGVGLLTGSHSEQEPKPGATPVKVERHEAKADRYGDPLPPGAIARLGTVRFRTWATSIAFLLGDKVLATMEQEAVSFWDVSTGKETRHMVEMRWGEASALSADGKLLAVATVPNDNTIHLWELATGKHLRQFQGHPGRIHALAFSTDGRTLVSTGGRQVWVWDTATGKEIWHAEVGPAELGVAVSPNGKTVVSAGWDVASAVSVREMATGKELHRFKLPLGVRQVGFAPDSKTLAAIEDWNDEGGLRENRVHLWDVATGKLNRQLTSREHILCAAFSPDGKCVATGHLDTFHVWDVATGKWLDRFEGNACRIDRLAFSGDGKSLATIGENTIRLWDTATGKEMRYPGDGHQSPVDALTFLGKGATLVSASGDHTLRHWDAATGREVCRFSGMGVGVYSPSFAIMERLGAHSVSHEVRLFDPATGKELRRLRYPDHVARIALTKDGKTLAVYTGGKDLTLRLVDTATGKERLARQHPDFVQAMAFSPGGDVLALGPVKPILPILDTATGSEIYQLRLSENVTNLTFSPDGKTLAGGAGYGTLRFWEVATGKERAQWLDRDLRSGSQMAFSPDGRLLALGDADGRLRLVSAATGKELKRLQGHRNGFTCLAFAPDGKTLASGNWDTTCLVWDVSGLREKGELAADLGPKQLEALWIDLASDDAARAYRVIHTLAAAPQQSVQFLAGRVQPRQPVTDERIAQLIAELDNERFETREKAAAELAGLERRAEPLLRKTLDGDPSPEVRRRIESLLNKLQGPVTFPETMRLLRTIEVLERIATPEARQLLEKLVGGVPEARLTRDAKAALGRLGRQ
jgi:RNA polymerase sigma factor (sigma-70 family)